MLWASQNVPGSSRDGHSGKKLVLKQTQSPHWYREMKALLHMTEMNQFFFVLLFKASEVHEVYTEHM